MAIPSILQRILHRKAEEVADQLVFLASPKAAFTTGTNIVVDGGLTKRIQF